MRRIKVPATRPVFAHPSFGWPAFIAYAAPSCLACLILIAVR
jgi:hypothetical protein